MAKYSKEKFVESLANDDEIDEINNNFETINNDKLSIVVNIFSLNGKPFSAVNRQILPQLFDETEELFDEFGFQKLVGDECNDPTKELNFLESSKTRMKWLSLIEFAHEHTNDDLVWKNVQVDRIRNNSKFNELLQNCGISHSLRPFLWPQLSGASEKKKKAPCKYFHILHQSYKDSNQQNISPQIEKDLLKILSNNFCFSRLERLGTQALKRLLKSLAFMYPDLGYCQGVGVVVANLLLVCIEEDTFWIMCSLIEEILPSNYYNNSLLSIRADERIVKYLIQVHMPDLMELINKSELDISTIIRNWLLTLLSSSLPIRILLRVWDLFFSSGLVIIFRIIISLLKMNEEYIIEKAQTSQNFLKNDFFAFVKQIPNQISNVDNLIEFAQSFEYSITDHLIKELRKKNLNTLMANNGLIYTSNINLNLPKQKVNRRKLSTKSKSILKFLKYSDKTNLDDEIKAKNIQQTELVIDLKNSILQICLHFADCTTEKHEKPIIMQADYSVDCNALYQKQFYKARREGKKRARALLDFERQEKDELGFRKNQLITIISEKDEHCWVGELNGEQGWFPAKFVKVIDERGKNYCAQGDEAVDFKIVELTRGSLSLSIQQILFHGIRRPNRISLFYSHPWQFIETLSTAMVENQQKTANLRLTLCDTFNLDQDGKILSPEELLFKAVQTINVSHNSVNVDLDTKLRSLICYALNEQCLHLWFDIFCSSKNKDYIRKRYYHSWSFICSPVAHQIKCELQLLSQFAFNLNIDPEISSDFLPKNNNSFFISKLKIPSKAFQNSQSLVKKSTTFNSVKNLEKQPLREGVQDILIKHHLFSWDL